MDKRVPAATIRRLWLDPDLTQTEAAARAGLSRVRFWVRAKALGLPAKKEGRRPVIPDDELRVLWAADVAVREIAALYGCPATSVRPSARRLRLPGRPSLPHSTITMSQFRHHLLQKAYDPNRRLSDPERAILARTRDT